MAKRKTRGERGIEEHHGKWRYHFQLPGRPRVKASTGLAAIGRNLSAARRMREDHIQRLLLGLPEPIEDIPFSEASKRFLAWKTSKHRDRPSTAKRVKTSLASWKALLAHKNLAEVFESDVLDYMQWRRETGVREVTLRKDMLAMRMLCEYGRAHRWIAHDPTTGIEMPSDRDSKNERVATIEEQRIYLAEADRHSALGDVARLILNQGLRPDCEVLQMRWENVDLEAGKLCVPRSKSTASERALTLAPESRLILGRRTRDNRTPWVFPGLDRIRGRHRKYRQRSDRPLSYHGIRNAHDRVLAKTGLNFVLYSFRHTFATEFYDRTGNLVALKDILGHSDLRTVLRYVNDRQRRMDEAMRLFCESKEGERLEVLQ